MLPPLGDGVPHLVQAEVQLLDHVTVAVPDVGRPRQEEVVGWLPHGLNGVTEGSEIKWKGEAIKYGRQQIGRKYLIVFALDSTLVFPWVLSQMSHLAVQQPVPVAVWRLVGLHLLS